MLPLFCSVQSVVRAKSGLFVQDKVCCRESTGAAAGREEGGRSSAAPRTVSVCRHYRGRVYLRTKDTVIAPQTSYHTTTTVSVILYNFLFFLLYSKSHKATLELLTTICVSISSLFCVLSHEYIPGFMCLVCFPHISYLFTLLSSENLYLILFLFLRKSNLTVTIYMTRLVYKVSYTRCNSHERSQLAKIINITYIASILLPNNK